MTNNIYVLYNIVENRYSINPAFGPTDGAVVRDFVPQMKQNNQNIDDYILYCVGTYDLDSGLISVCDRRVVSWTSYKFPETVSKPISPEDFKRDVNELSQHQGDNYRTTDVPLSQM